MRPRFEFRVWGRLEHARRLVATNGTETGQDAAADCYLVGPNLATNAKLRDGRLEVKRLIATCDDLQQWEPAWSAELPLAPDDLNRLFSELGLAPGPKAADGLLSERRLEAAVAGSPGGSAATVHKARRHFAVDGVIAEITDVTAGQSQLWTIAVEGVDADRVRRVAGRLGLRGENRPMHEMAVTLANGEGP